MTKSDLEKARQVKAIIEKQYYVHYTYQMLAEQVGTNPVKLQKAFKVIAGHDLYEYLIIVRIAKAKELLENTEIKIDVIASKVGWDKTNLNKQFKTFTGMTPGAWRLRHEAHENVDNRQQSGL